MTYAKDVAGPYMPAVQANTLVNLINTLLGYDLGQQIISDLTRNDEIVTPQSLRDRLRVAVRAGALSRLTAKRLEKLQAALELGRQLYVEEVPCGNIIDDPHKAAAVFNCIAWEPMEKFAIACLDIKHRLLGCKVIASGTATETIACPREIFSAAIQSGATRLIVAHNHPSGHLEPSPEDISLTKQLLNASEVMSIPIIEHLIVSRGAYTSLRQTTDLWSN